MPMPPNSCAKSSETRPHNRLPPRMVPQSPLFSPSPSRKAQPPHTEVGLFALLFAPPPQPCNPSAPHFSYLTCNISKKAKIFARTPTFASSKQKPCSPTSGAREKQKTIIQFAQRNRRPLPEKILLYQTIHTKNTTMKFFLTTAFALCVALGTQAQSNTWITGSTNQTQSVDLSTFGSNPTFTPPQLLAQ